MSYYHGDDGGSGLDSTLKARPALKVRGNNELNISYDRSDPRRIYKRTFSVLCEKLEELELEELQATELLLEEDRT